MSDSDLDRLSALVAKIVGKRFFQAIGLVATLSFGFGVWLARMEGLYSDLAKAQAGAANTVADIGNWREKKNDKDAEQDVRIARVEERR